MPSLFLIENDRELASCLRRILEAEGYDVHWSETISHALAAIDEAKPVAAIVDLHDGTSIKPDHLSDLTDRAKDLHILVTAHYQTPEIAYKALSNGADDYLLKPFSTREIIERLRRLTGSVEQTEPPDPLGKIASSIGILGNIHEIFRICLDQLAGTLHLTDCLIALNSDEGFKVHAGRGYAPDPVGRTVTIPPGSIEALTADSQDDIAVITDVVKDIVADLGLVGHRPFPILMPLRHPDSGPEHVMGFVLGHGALILDEKDLLEIERFLGDVAVETAALLAVNPAGDAGLIYETEGEIHVPDTDRVESVRLILGKVSEYLPSDSDLFWVRLALDEAISNAIIHGHGEALGRPERDVRIRYSLGPTRIVITVEDSGEGFDHAHLPDPTADENLLNINGRGIYLMRTIMDEVIYNDYGNRVSMTKILDGNPVGPITPGNSPDRARHKNLQKNT